MPSNVYFPRNLGFHLYGQVLSNSPLCDTIMQVGENKQIMCHAAIISCASDIIKELLDLSTVNQNGKKVLNFTSACSETMFCVLDYIYTGRETYNAANVTRVLTTALLVGCRTLQAMCLNFIEITRKQLIGMHNANSKNTMTPQNTNAGNPTDEDSCSNPSTHQPLHRVLRIAKSPPTSSCASPRSDVEDIDTLDSPNNSDSEQNATSVMSSPNSVNGHAQTLLPLTMPSIIPQTISNSYKNAIKMSNPFIRQNQQMSANCMIGNTARQNPTQPSDLKKYCKECNRSFATVGSYTRHLRMIHYKLRPLNCETCGHAFYQRSDLKKHIQRQHQRDNVENMPKALEFK